MNEPLLPPPLMKVAHVAPFDTLIRNYVGMDNDLLGGESPYYYASILNIDTVPSSMLPYLADMLGVNGYKGFDYAATDALKRQTLKNAFLMKRRHGTVWCLTTALENAGFRNVVINDRLYRLFFDGTWQFDGTSNFNSNYWADFEVYLEPPIDVLPADVDVVKLTQLINYWKRGCARLVKLQINQIVIVSFGVGDGSLQFDGSWQFDGSNQFVGIY